MRIMILGGDGYLGWPSSMYFAAQGHDVLTIDNHSRRKIAHETDSDPLLPNPDLPERTRIFNAVSNGKMQSIVGDCADYAMLGKAFQDFAPDTVVHYAEQPSAPYSMQDVEKGRYTLINNLSTTYEVLQCVRNFAPNAHIVKLGTMGEYGTPNIDIEEGWLNIEHNGRKDRFLFPRQAGSLYHTTKVLDTDLIWFFVRTYGMKVTDLMQGPVYGLETNETGLDGRLYPNFHYDDIFGTVLNRFIVQAVAGVPLTVYGKGGQTRGYLNIRDTLKCIELAAANPPGKGELRIFNQFTETFSVNELADRVQRVGKAAGFDVKVNSIPNPRKEMEEHYYNPKFTGLKELGLEPTLLTDEVIGGMIDIVARHREAIDTKRILPRVSWNA